MEKFFKSSLFGFARAEYFTSLAVSQPDIMVFLTRFLYRKLIEKNRLNSKYEYFIETPEIKSSLIKHILALPEDERYLAIKMAVTEKKTNLSICVRESKEFQSLKDAWKKCLQTQQKVLKETKEVQQQAQKTVLKEAKAQQQAQKNALLHEAEQKAELPSKKDINNEKMAIYNKLVMTVLDSSISVVEKIDACCKAIDLTTDQGKLLAASNRSLSSLRSSNSFDQVFKLIKEELTPQIKSKAEAEHLKTKLTIVRHQLQINKITNTQLESVFVFVTNRCKAFDVLPENLNLHDDKDSLSINTAIKGLGSCWYCLYPDILSTIESVKMPKSERKELLNLLEALNSAIVNPVNYGDDQNKAIELHFAVQTAATNLKRCLSTPTISNLFAENPSLEQAVSIIHTKSGTAEKRFCSARQYNGS
ncbi:MAG: hypothetical protein HKM04_02760 [Legionellales bacterium]|nr:hypothetical protein [Legionellales bacterium]